MYMNYQFEIIDKQSTEFANYETPSKLWGKTRRSQKSPSPERSLLRSGDGLFCLALLRAMKRAYPIAAIPESIPSQRDLR